MKRLLIIAIAAACAKGSSEKPPDIQTAPALQQAADCPSLLASVQETAVRQMRASLDAEKSNTFYGPPVAVGGTANAPTAGSAPASYSTTNTQVAGVDEADFVKNDGTRIFTLSGQTLRAAQSWPPQSLAVQGTLTIEGWPSDMFLQDNQLVVFSNIWDAQPVASGVALPATAIACPLDGCWYGSSSTKITVIDATDLAALKVSAELYLPGYETGARRIGSSVRLVLSDEVRWPDGLQWWPDYNPIYQTDHDALVQAIDALESANEQIIRATPLVHWFPDGKRKLADGSVIDVSYQCSDFYLSNAPEQLGLVTVATIDLDHLDQGVARSSIVGESGIIYANEQHLYVATPHWWWWPLSGQRDWTYLHVFDLTDPSKAAYLGSGGIEGHLGDQFALDESDGYLRAATTTIDYSVDANGNFHEDASNALHVLALQGAHLKNVASLSPIVAGEAITSTRFSGNQGYVVTFRNFDPLATLDLSDPLHPQKIAELTLPGFSQYLQPIDGTHLLAIGEDLPIDATGAIDWSHRTVDISLFDVSDLAHPARAAVATVGTAWSSSEAEWDHHAFNWYQPDPAKPGLLAIPFADWNEVAGNDWWDGFVSDVRLFSVDPAAGTVTAAGALGMSDIYIQEGSGDWTWFYKPWVRRSVLSTGQDGTQYVYAISDAGIRVAPLSDLAHPLATALFQ